VTIEIELDGERRQVALRREGDRWIAEMGGRRIDASVVEVGGRWSMLVNPAEAGLHGQAPRNSDPRESGFSGNSSVESGFNGNSSVESGFNGNSSVESGFSRISDASDVVSAFRRTSYEVAFEPTAAGDLIVHVNGVAIPLTIARAPGPSKPASPKPVAEAGGPQTIVAPMAGRIVRVLVKPDERVSARQPLVVVEAMKMENELRAPRGGTVAEVRVAEGSSVEANAVLVVLR
jgi:biotin carboxyl carrier protein